MKYTSLTFFLSISIFFTPLCAESKDKTQRPNIVFFLFDDMGWGQPQSYNPSSALRTPNLDKLTTQGMRFTDAHSAAAVCTPTRYGVITGRNPSRIGQIGVCSPRSKPIIPTSRMTIASMLKDKGYRTACIGKWHLGLDWLDEETKSPPVLGEEFKGGPEELGFDYTYGYSEARSLSLIFEHDKVIKEVPEIDNQIMMADKAVEWIGKQSKEEPFFLYFPVCPPHTPVVPAMKYRGVGGGKDLVKNKPFYADWVYQGDVMLGQIMEALKKAGLDENTLLVVSSDNGAAGRAYAPLKKGKGSIYEGGHRVPYVVRWPHKVKAGSVWNHPISLNDLMATVAEITGAEIPDNAAEDSFSYLQAILGKTTKPTADYLIHQSKYGDFAIRKGDWKAVYPTSGIQELYNLKDDIGEKNNLAEQYPDKLKELTALFEKSNKTGRTTPGKAQKIEYQINLGKREARKNVLK